jgi:hypothetical protein
VVQQVLSSADATAGEGAPASGLGKAHLIR